MRRGQIAIQYILLVGGVVIIATALFLIASGFIRTGQEEISAAQATSFDLLKVQFTKAIGTIQRLDVEWSYSEYGERTEIVLKNPGAERFEGLISVNGSVFPQGVRVGTILVTSEDGEEIASRESADGCEYSEDDQVTFLANVEPGKNKTYFLYYGYAYFGNTSCGETTHSGFFDKFSKSSVKKSVSGSQDYVCLGAASFRGDGTVTGKVPVVLGEEPVLFECEEPTEIHLEASDVEISAQGCFVFKNATFVDQDQAVFFEVPGCLEKVGIYAENKGEETRLLTIRDSGEKSVRGSRQEYYDFPIPANTAVSDELVVTRPGVWSVALPPDLKLSLSGNLSGFFAYSQGTLCDPAFVSYCGLPVLDVRSTWKEDSNPPVVNQTIIQPLVNESEKMPDTQSVVNITILASDAESFVYSCRVYAEGACGGGCEMVPSDMKYDEENEYLFAELGRLSVGEKKINVSCFDAYMNRFDQEVEFEVFGSPDASSPVFLPVDGAVMGVSPFPVKAASDATFTISVEDAESPISGCSFFVKDKTKSVDMEEIEGTYMISKKIKAKAVVSDISIGSLSSEYLTAIAQCTDASGNKNSTYLAFEVKEGTPPKIESIETDPRGVLNGSIELGTEVTIRVEASDNVGVDKCFIAHTTPGYTTPPVPFACVEGCGAASPKTFEYESSGWVHVWDYDVYINCTDVSGNVASVKASISSSDTTKPRISSLERLSSNPLLFQAVVSDAQGVDKCALSFYKPPVPNPSSPDPTYLLEKRTLRGNTGTFTFTMSSEEDAPYTAIVECEDASGNKALSAKTFLS